MQVINGKYCYQGTDLVPSHEPGFSDVCLVVSNGDAITHTQHTQQLEVAIILSTHSGIGMATMDTQSCTLKFNSVDAQ